MLEIPKFLWKVIKYNFEGIWVFFWCWFFCVIDQPVYSPSTGYCVFCKKSHILKEKK